MEHKDKFIALSAYIKMLQTSPTNHLIAHLKAKNEKLYPKQKTVKNKHTAEINKKTNK